MTPTSHTPNATAISPEMRLAVAVLSHGRDSERLTDALREADPQLLVRLLDREGLLPLFAGEISRIPTSRLPPELAERLRNALEFNTARNLALVRELLRIIDLCAASGIQIVPFKGPVFALQCHANVGMRDCSDLDILIQAEDLGKLRALFAGNGFHEEIPLRQGEQPLYVRAECEFNFIGADDTLIEAHWRFMPSYYTVRDLPGLWEDLVELPVAGRTIRVLSAEHHLLALVQHGTKHSWENLGLVLDIANWVQANPHLDCSKLFHLAHQSHMRRMLALALELARQVTGLEISAACGSAICNEPELQQLARELVPRLTRSDKYVRDLGTMSFILRVLDSWKDRLRFVLRLAFRPSAADFLWLRLPTSMVFLYPFVRVFRLSWMALRQISRLAFQRNRTKTA